MKKIKRSTATAMMAAMSLSVLPTQMFAATVSTSSAKKVETSKTEITVGNNKSLKKALNSSVISRIIIQENSAKNLRIPKGNYKNKTLVINAVDKSNIYIAKGAKLKKIIYVGAVKNGKLVVDEAGSKIEIASKTNLTISGKAAYAEITYSKGAESAGVTSNIDLIINNKTKKSVSASIAGKKVTVKAGEVYSNQELDINSDDTPQGAINTEAETSEQESGTDTKKESAQTAESVSAGESGGASNISVVYEETGKVENKKLVNEARTRLLDLGVFSYVVVGLNEKLDKKTTSIWVDGTDVTSEVTYVDDEGTIVKWEVSDLKPAKLEVKKGNAVEVIKLSNNENPVKPVVTNKRKSPSYIMGYGAIPTWDYYLSNYDNEQKVRVKPKKTTFSSDFKETESLSAVPYYSPDAILKESEDGTGSGNIEIMFNYNTAEEKEWFDAIGETGALALIEDDENQYILNGNLVYTKEIRENPYKAGQQRGVLIIPISSRINTNMGRNGRYRVAIKPVNGMSIMTRVHIVNEVAPELKLKEHEAQSGKNLHFKVSNFIQPLKNAVERVELTSPDGQTRELRYISDYFMFNELFVLYNDITKGDEEKGTKGVNNIPYNGEYKLKIYFNGYKNAEKSFVVTNGKELPVKETGSKFTVMGLAGFPVSIEGIRFDAVAGATGVSVPSTDGSGTSSGGSSSRISANIIFNVDLYSNAAIFDKLKIKNAYAEGIMDRFESKITNFTAVYSEDGKIFYDWTDYADAVHSAKLAENGSKYLTFADYVLSGKATTTNKVSSAKEVLEDNRLGELIMDGSYIGMANDDLIVNGDEGATGDEKLGENEVYGDGQITILGDKNYLSKILSVKAEKTLSRGEDYTVENGKLVIKASALLNESKTNYGVITVVIEADGYNTKTVDITVKERGGKETKKTVKKVSIDYSKYSFFKPKYEIDFGTTEQDWIRGVKQVFVNGKEYTNTMYGIGDVYDLSGYTSGKLGIESYDIGVDDSKELNITIVDKEDLRWNIKAKRSRGIQWLEAAAEGTASDGGSAGNTAPSGGTGTENSGNQSGQTAPGTAPNTGTGTETGGNQSGQTPPDTEVQPPVVSEGKDLKYAGKVLTSASEIRVGGETDHFMMWSNSRKFFEEEWINGIESVEVDGTAYSRVEQSYFRISDGNEYTFSPRGLIIYNKTFRGKEEIVLRIKSSGYKTYEFTVNVKSAYGVKVTDFKVVQ